jgi:hypothetical protein
MYNRKCEEAAESPRRPRQHPATAIAVDFRPNTPFGEGTGRDSGGRLSRRAGAKDAAQEQGEEQQHSE